MAILYAIRTREEVGVIIGLVVSGVPCALSFLQNLMRLKLRTWKCCGRLLEFILSLLISLWILFVAITYFWIASHLQDAWTDWNGETFCTVVLLVLAMLQVISTIGSFLDILNLGRKGLRQPYNISRGPSDGDLSPSRRIEIFGAATWAQRYQYDSARKSIFSIGFWGLFYRPAQTLGAGASETPTKHSWATTDYHTFSAPASILLTFPSPVPISAENSLNVTAVSSANIINNSCKFLPLSPNANVSMGALCEIPESRALWLNDSLSIGWRREILYVVNFPSIFDSSSLHSFYMTNIVNTSYQGISLDAMMRSTHGALIWPGANLVALASFSRWDELTKPVAAAVGLPTLDSSPPNLQSNQSATIKVVFDYLTSQVLVERASIENTFLGAHSALFLFGLKPLSVYGLVHSFSRTKPELYVREHDLTSDDNQRLLRTLHQHLLDTGEHHVETQKLPDAESSGEREMLVSDSEEAEFHK
ncbi:hypothetical protein NP233_g6155 [Leucocoprinus birnbaumii]|uniref:Uncharacterized protein n=1 Tax=Leucocoprinus birnbaumii TaxID=56174 RepID=A0AAD5VUA2_9AGAR|nr:hypothetical protein NP233_g6155 [Leucocoprinus birnbaumii]